MKILYILLGFALMTSNGFGQNNDDSKMEQRLTFITLGVDDLINALRNKGIRIIKEPQKVFWGGYNSYIEDPDGNLREIAYNPFPGIYGI